jgi:hypothetical protein
MLPRKENPANIDEAFGEGGFRKVLGFKTPNEPRERPEQEADADGQNDNGEQRLTDDASEHGRIE